VTITLANREIIRERSGGQCELCRSRDATNMHHRRPRGMGGTKRDIHTPAWILHVCGSGTHGCHGLIESRRALAYTNGWLLRNHEHPSTTPAWLFRSLFVILTDKGTYEPWGQGWHTNPTAATPGGKPARSSSRPAP
jgi:hypothetical protein